MYLNQSNNMQRYLYLFILALLSTLCVAICYSPAIGSCVGSTNGKIINTVTDGSLKNHLRVGKNPSTEATPDHNSSSNLTSHTVAAKSANVTVFIWNGTGDHDNPNFWSGNSVPSDNPDSIVIASGTCRFDGDFQLRNIRIEAGASLIVTGVLFGGNNLNVSGNLSAMELNPGTATVNMFGGGTISCSTFVKNRGGDITINNTKFVVNMLDLGPDVSLIGPNARLRIQYNPGGSHGINFRGGTIIQQTDEQFEIEAYFDPSSTTANGGAWFNVGPPIQNYNVNELSNNNPFAAGTYNSGVATNSSLYLYDPTNNTWPTNLGYVKAPNANYRLAASEGTRVWLRTAKLNQGALVFSGRPFLEDQTFNLSYCPSGCTYGSPNGYNLIKNPFPAVLDWASADIIRTNMDDAIWIWRSDLGQFASFVGGVGINGGRETVAIGQSFFVRANGSGADVFLPTSSLWVDRIAAPFRMGAIDNLIKLKVMSGTSAIDEAAIRFLNTATSGYDAQYDAADMAGNNTGISSLLPDGTPMGINVLPLLRQTSIPLSFTRIQSGQTLTVSLAGIAVNTQLWLNHPSFTSPIPVTDGLSLPLTASLASGLELIAAPGQVTNLLKLVTPRLTLHPNPASTTLQLELSTGTIKGVTILDQLGRTVLSNTIPNGDNLDISSLAAGCYFVRVTTDQGVMSQRLAVVR